MRKRCKDRTLLFCVRCCSVFGVIFPANVGSADCSALAVRCADYDLPRTFTDTLGFKLCYRFLPVFVFLCSSLVQVTLGIHGIRVPANRRHIIKTRKMRKCNNRHVDTKLAPKSSDANLNICITFRDKPGEGSTQLNSLGIWPRLGYLCTSWHWNKTADSESPLYWLLVI
jgi:hypothetical protein